MFFSTNIRRNRRVFVCKKISNVFDQDISEFVSSDILEQQIEEEFLNESAFLDPKDNIMKQEKTLWRLKKKELDSVFSMKKFRQKKH